MSTCAHGVPLAGRPHTVRCALGLFGGRPHIGVCRHCSVRSGTPPGQLALPAKRRPCPEEVAKLDRRAQEYVDTLKASGHPAAAHYAMRLEAASGLAFTPCARAARLRAILEESGWIATEAEWAL